MFYCIYRRARADTVSTYEIYIIRKARSDVITFVFRSARRSARSSVSRALFLHSIAVFTSAIISFVIERLLFLEGTRVVWV